MPPTAQATIQEAAVAAGNLVAELMDAQPRQFVYHPLGMLVDLGSRFAVSQVLNRRLSGGIAQRCGEPFYHYKLGDSRDRVGVMVDWLLDWWGGPRITRIPMN